MICPICTASLPPTGASVCSHCGAALPPSFVAPAGRLDFSAVIADRTRDFTGREWVFKAIDDWLVNAEGPRIFLLSGAPGSGKTAIAGRLMQFAQGQVPSPEGLTRLTPGFLSAVHFCSARDRRWINPHVFAESLAIQLAARYPAYAKALAEKRNDRQIHIDVEQRVQDMVGGQLIGVIINNLDVRGASAEDAFIRVVREPLEALLLKLPDQQVVIMVDALDEALVYSEPVGIVALLAQAQGLPRNVCFILTSRPDERVENAFLDADGLYLSSHTFEQANREDLQRYIRTRLSNDPALGVQAAQLTREHIQALLKALMESAAGNFLYVRFLVDEMARGHRPLSELGGLPEGLDGLYYESLDRVIKLGGKAWVTAYAPVLGVLSVAQASLHLKELEAFTGQSIEMLWGQLGDLQQFIEEVVLDESEPSTAQTDEAHGYRLYHQSVVDFLRRPFLEVNYKRLRNGYYLPADQWHQKIVAHYRGKASSWDEVDWRQVDDYGLRYLMVHLYALRNDPQYRPELYQLICQSFMQQKRLRYGSHQPFAADVALAIEAASAEEPPNILELVHGCLLYATLGSLATNIDPEVLGVLAQVGQVANAQGHAALIPNVARRSQAYLFIGKALLERNQREEAKESLLQALSAAEVIRDERHQAQAVSIVARALAGAGEVGRALAAVKAIEDESYRAHALRELVQTLMATEQQSAAVTVVNQMLAELPRQRLTVDQRLSAELGQSRPSQEFLLLRYKRLAMEDALGKAYRLRECAQALAVTGQRIESIQVVSQALAVVEGIAEQELTISESEAIADALSEVALVLAQAGEKGKATVVAEQALITASAIARWNLLRKEDVQCKVAQVMVQTGDKAGLKRVLTALGAFKRKDIFYELSWVAEVMAQAGDKGDAREVINQAFAAVKTIEVEHVKAEALGRVAQVLATVGETEGLNQVLAAVEPMKDLPSKASALSSVAQVLAHIGETGKASDVAKQALATAMKIEVGWQKADALGRVAEALALAGEVDRALATVAQNGPQPNGVRMLGKVAQTLVERGEYEKAADVANQSVASAETVGNMGAKAGALGKMAQALALVGKKDHAAEIADRAFAFAETIEEKTTHRAALGTVAQAFALSGEFEKALTTLAAAEVHGKMQPAYMLSGVATALALAGAQGQAAAVARQALAAAVERRDRDSRDYDLKEVVQALAQAGEWDQALEATKKVETEWLREYALAEVVQILAQAGQYKKALEAVTNVSGTTRADVRSRLSLARAQVGDTGEAVELANQALMAATNGRLDITAEVTVLSRTAQALAHAGDMDRAVTIANRALAAVTKVRQEWIKAIALSGLTRAFALAGEKGSAAHSAKQALSAVMVIEKNIPANRQEEAFSRVAEALTLTGQHEQVLVAYGSEFRLARTIGRDRVFEVLGNIARLIAAIDQGRTLWDLYNTMMAVESWWSTPRI